MKSYTITVNGNVYEVTVEEGFTGAAPAAAPEPIDRLTQAQILKLPQALKILIRPILQQIKISRPTPAEIPQAKLKSRRGRILNQKLLR